MSGHSIATELKYIYNNLAVPIKGDASPACWRISGSGCGAVPPGGKDMDNSARGGYEPSWQSSTATCTAHLAKLCSI